MTATVTTAESEAPARRPPLRAVPPLPAPPLPRPLITAFEADRTVVLLIVKRRWHRRRGYRRRRAACSAFQRDVALFVVPADQIARYAAITQGVDVNRVPALVVGPAAESQTTDTVTASVSYGFQSPQSIVQAVVDAGYEGPTLTYHP